MGLKGFDQSVLEEPIIITSLEELLATMLTSLFSTLLYLICAMLPSLLCCVALGGVLPGRIMIKAVALILIWYLGPAFMPYLYFGNHLAETLHNFIFSLFSSKSQSVEEREGHLPLFSLVG